MKTNGNCDDRRIAPNLEAYDPSKTFAAISGYFESACSAMLHERNAKKSLLSNPADIGKAIEGVYREFLKQHVPAKSDILEGGYVFDVAGRRSHQMDIIVHSGDTHRFRDTEGQACATLEGTVADIEVTSYLAKRKIDDELKKFAHIPPMAQFRGLGNRREFEKNPDLKEFWADAPYKAVIAFDGVDASPL